MLLLLYYTENMGVWNMSVILIDRGEVCHSKQLFGRIFLSVLYKNPRPSYSFVLELAADEDVVCSWNCRCSNVSCKTSRPSGQTNVVFSTVVFKVKNKLSGSTCKPIWKRSPRVAQNDVKFELLHLHDNLENTQFRSNFKTCH